MAVKESQSRATYSVNLKIFSMRSRFALLIILFFCGTGWRSDC